MTSSSLAERIERIAGSRVTLLLLAGWHSA